MANVPHSGLTGADLHESKGVASAAVDTVFVTDGAGSGVHKKVPAAALAAAANPFAAQLFHAREQLPAGTASPSRPTGWSVCPLTTLRTNEITSAALSSNQIQLPAGTYYFEASDPTSYSGTSGSAYQIRLRNVTAGSTIISSSLSWNISATGNSGSISPLVIRGRFTLAGTTVLELQHWYNVSGPNIPNINTGEVNVGADIVIWKVA